MRALTILPAAALLAPARPSVAQEQRPAIPEAPNFRIAVGSWSFHMPIWRGELPPGDLPALIRKEYDVGALEWSSELLRALGENHRPQYQAPRDAALGRALRARCDAAGVECTSLLVGGPAVLGDSSSVKRKEAVSHYLSWVETAAALGCDAIRINVYSNLPPGPDRDRRAFDLCAEGVRRVLEGTRDSGVNVNLENHGGISARADWLAKLLREVDDKRLRAIVDLNNFRWDLDLPYAPDRDSAPRWYDRKRGVGELAPWAHSVSAKAFAFDHTGWESSLDYPGLMKILLDAGFRGDVVVEYEGAEDPIEGVRKTVAMLRRLRGALS
ncbi:MAG: sugar phosphate isomerase/epimerase family protein [Myxococcota bacterium]